MAVTFNFINNATIKKKNYMPKDGHFILDIIRGFK